MSVTVQVCEIMMQTLTSRSSFWPKSGGLSKSGSGAVMAKLGGAFKVDVRLDRFEGLKVNFFFFLIEASRGCFELEKLLAIYN